MRISRKRFSKKHSKKSIKKNTRKHKKRHAFSKYKKTSRKFHFLGGVGEEEECPICQESLENGDPIFTTNCAPKPHKFHTACIEQWCNNKSSCSCPSCRQILDPNPNPNLGFNTNEINGNTLLYRVQFFKVINDEQVPISVLNIPDQDIQELEDIFLNRVTTEDGVRILDFDNIDFFGGVPENNDPYGYIKPTLGREDDINYINSFHSAMRRIINIYYPISIRSSGEDTRYIAHITITHRYGA